MKYQYKTQYTCSQLIDFELNGNVVTNISFYGGCNGNLKAISKLVEGQDPQTVISILKGNDCGSRGTSCADQFAKGLEEALKREWFYKKSFSDLPAVLFSALFNAFIRICRGRCSRWGLRRDLQLRIYTDRQSDHHAPADHLVKISDYFDGGSFVAPRFYGQQSFCVCVKGDIRSA